MKHTATILALIAMIATAPPVHAESPSCHGEEIALGTQNNAGAFSIDWCYGIDAENGGQMQGSIFASTTAQGLVVLIQDPYTWTTNGCELTNATQTAGLIGTGYLYQLNITQRACSMSGTASVVDQLDNLVMEYPFTITSADSNEWPEWAYWFLFFLWTAYVLITTMMRNSIMGMTLAVLGFVILLLPLPDFLFEVLLVGQNILAIYMAFRLTGELT